MPCAPSQPWKPLLPNNHPLFYVYLFVSFSAQGLMSYITEHVVGWEAFSPKLGFPGTKWYQRNGHVKTEEKGSYRLLLSIIALCQTLSYFFIMFSLQCPSEVDKSGDACFSGKKMEFQLCKFPMFGEAGIATQLCLTLNTDTHFSELLCLLPVLSEKLFCSLPLGPELELAWVSVYTSLVMESSPPHTKSGPLCGHKTSLPGQTLCLHSTLLNTSKVVLLFHTYYYNIQRWDRAPAYSPCKLTNSLCSDWKDPCKSSRSMVLRHGVHASPSRELAKVQTPWFPPWLAHLKSQRVGPINL